jgi:hypothetical protein
MDIVMTDEITGAEVACPVREIAVAIRPWFLDAPDDQAAGIADTITALQDALSDSAASAEDVRGLEGALGVRHSW